MAAPHVTFIIVTFNNETEISVCLDHIYQQRGSDYSVIVVDNASEDQTVNKIKSSCHPVELIQNTENKGFAAANNQGIAAAAESDFVALVNPDAYLYPDWLKNMRTAAAKNTDCHAFTSLLLAPDRETIDGTGDILHVSGHAWRRYIRKKVTDVSLKEERVFSANAAAALYQREALEKTGGFDEDFFCYFEDVDLGTRLNLQGYKTLFVPSAKAVHAGFSSSGAFTHFPLYHGHRNLEWAFFKNTPLGALFLLLPIHVIAVLITMLGFLLTGKGRPLVQAKWHAIKGLSSAVRKRRRIHSRRVISTIDYLKLVQWSGYLRKSSRLIKHWKRE